MTPRFPLDAHRDVPPDASPYVRARIIGGLLLLSLVIFLGVVDAFSPNFQIDTVQFGLLLGTSLAMLGLDAVGRRLFP